MEFSILFKTKAPTHPSMKKNLKKPFYAEIIILAKTYFFPLKKSKILSRSVRSGCHLDLRNFLIVRPPIILKKISCFSMNFKAILGIFWPSFYYFYMENDIFKPTHQPKVWKIPYLFYFLFSTSSPIQFSTQIENPFLLILSLINIFWIKNINI